MGKSFLTLELLKHWEDNFNSTPLTQIVFLSKTKCSPKFRQELSKIAQSLGIELKVFDNHGVLSPEYQDAFKRFYEAQNGETSDPEKHVRVDGEIDESESEGEVTKDTSGNMDNDECTAWLTSVIASRNKSRGNKARIEEQNKNVDYLRGLRKKGPRTGTLSAKSKLGGHRRAKDFLKLNDRQVRDQKSLLLRTGEPAITHPIGGAVSTRSRTAALRNGTKDEEKNPVSSRFFDKKEKVLENQKEEKVKESVGKDQVVKDTNKEDHHINQPDKTNQNDNEQTSKESDFGEQTGRFDLKRGGLVIVDDAFVTSTDDDSEGQNANARSETLYRTIKHLNLFTEASSHHFGVSLVIVSQSPQIVTGSSVLANYVRRLKQCIDIFIVFKMDSSTARHFLNTISTGENYQNLKRMLSFATEPPSNYTIDPFDQRGCWPYFVFTLSNQACNPNLKYR